MREDNVVTKVELSPGMQELLDLVKDVVTRTVTEAIEEHERRCQHVLDTVARIGQECRN